MTGFLKHGILKQISRSPGGLPKRAIVGPVMLSERSIEGDNWRNAGIHGGRDKAVLMVSAEFIDDLAARGFPVFYGALGENLTVSGMDPHLWRFGQRYRLGQDAIIELTSLRTPCQNLDVYGPQIKSEIYDARCHAGDITSPYWALGGFYARVVRRGLIQAGDAVVLESDIA
jgi:MOSC domain-containing protein YiiM